MLGSFLSRLRYDTARKALKAAFLKPWIGVGVREILPLELLLEGFPGSRIFELLRLPLENVGPLHGAPQFLSANL